MTFDYNQDNLQISLDSPLGNGALLVHSLSGTERLSEPFHLQLGLFSESNNVDFDSLIGKPVSLRVLRQDEDTPRYFHGIVGRIVQRGSDRIYTRYQAEIYPWLWLLNFTSSSRIFQGKTVPDILESIFDEFGFSDYRNALSADYETRDYCVQYNESYFAFVSRLMEEEGIFYFFEHKEDSHILVLADSKETHEPCPAGAELTHRFDYSQIAYDSDLIDCEVESAYAASQFQTDDYNFEIPQTELLVSDGSVSSVSSVYEYPGKYGSKSRGEILARLRLEQLEHPKEKIRGRSTSYGLTSGYTLSVAEYPRADVNRDYLILSVSHELTQTTCWNSFEASPVDIPFRPQRRTRKPIIAGSQTAVVTGKDGEEIWTDEYGRIKVKFHWDQDPEKNENSSCWIRVAHGWAGKGWGTLMVPRVGMEVVVSFLNGDPDRPLVTGAVYNAQQSLPYDLPSEATRSTVKSNSSKGGEGYNEFRFEDNKDSEEIYLHAQRDMNIDILNDRTKKVGNDETIVVTNNRTATIEEGDETLTVSKGKRTVTISEGDDVLTVSKGNRTLSVDEGEESISVGSDRSVSVSGDETHSNDGDFTHEISGDFTHNTDGNHSCEVGGNYILTVDGDLTIDVSGSVTIKSGTSFTNEAGTSLTNKAELDLTNEAGTSLTNDAGTDLTNKAQLSQTVDGGVSLTIEGTIVQIN